MRHHLCSQVLRSVFGFCCVVAVLQHAAGAAQVPGGEQSAAEAAFRAGLKAAQAGKLTEAKSQFERVVQLAPSVAAGHSALGAVLVEQGNNAQALAELRSWIAQTLRPS